MHAMVLHFAYRQIFTYALKQIKSATFDYFLTKNSPKADKILLEGIPKEGTPWPTSNWIIGHSRLTPRHVFAVSSPVKYFVCQCPIHHQSRIFSAWLIQNFVQRFNFYGKKLFFEMSKIRQDPAIFTIFPYNSRKM